MTFRTVFQKHISKHWICSHCKRKNDKEDEKCAFCGEDKSAVKVGKFNSRRADYNGIFYHSKKEAAYAQTLDLRVLAGEVVSWTRQHKIEIKINGKKWRNYYIDFRAVRRDGGIEYLEIKGFSTEIWKAKWDALTILKNELLEPEAELIIIK